MNEFSPSIALTIVVLLLIEGFFSGSELALLSADRFQLKKKSKQGNSGAQMALRLLKAPERILSATLLMTSTCVMAISVLLTLEFRRLQGDHGEYWAVPIGSVLVILFGELIPKFFCRKFSSALVPRIARPIFYSQKLLSPLIHLISLYTSQISRVMRPIEQLWGGKALNAKDELQGLLTSDSDDTQIKTNEKKLIKKILRFREKIARDGYLPLVKVDAIERQSSLLDAFEIFHKTKHSRLPVFEDRVDNVIGVLELGSVLKQTDLRQRIDRFIKPAIYVPETQKLEPILNEMLERDYQIAIVVDEYGGSIGILTREDIFEQIVGDLEDEDDLENRQIRQTGPRSWILKARAPIAQVNEELGLDLPEGDYDSLGGFLLRQFSKIPGSGDELLYESKCGPLRFIIREATRRRIENVIVERLSDPSRSTRS